MNAIKCLPFLLVAVAALAGCGNRERAYSEAVQTLEMERAQLDRLEAKRDKSLADVKEQCEGVIRMAPSAESAAKARKDMLGVIDEGSAAWEKTLAPQRVRVKAAEAARDRLSPK